MIPEAVSLRGFFLHIFENSGRPVFPASSFYGKPKVRIQPVIRWLPSAAVH